MASRINRGSDASGCGRVHRRRGWRWPHGGDAAAAALGHWGWRRWSKQRRSLPACGHRRGHSWRETLLCGHTRRLSKGGRRCQAPRARAHSHSCEGNTRAGGANAESTGGTGGTESARGTNAGGPCDGDTSTSGASAGGVASARSASALAASALGASTQGANAQDAIAQVASAQGANAQGTSARGPEAGGADARGPRARHPSTGGACGLWRGGCRDWGGSPHTCAGALCCAVAALRPLAIGWRILWRRGQHQRPKARHSARRGCGKGALPCGDGSLHQGLIRFHAQWRPRAHGCRRGIHDLHGPCPL